MSPLLEPGDLLLWDSRTIHCNCPGPGSSLQGWLVDEALIELREQFALLSLLLEKRGRLLSALLAVSP